MEVKYVEVKSNIYCWLYQKAGVFFDYLGVFETPLAQSILEYFYLKSN
jgi:hypothetical protein